MDKLAKSAINRGLTIFNRDYDNKFRWWRDELDFTQLLFEGLIDYRENINKDADFLNEIAREARYVFDFARGDDGLYFKTVNPLGNSDKIYKRWKKVTGTDKKESLDKSQYCSSDTSKKANRELIVQAAAARIFLLTSKVRGEI